MASATDGYCEMDVTIRRVKDRPMPVLSGWLAGCTGAWRSGSEDTAPVPASRSAASAQQAKRKLVVSLSIGRHTDGDRAVGAGEAERIMELPVMLRPRKTKYIQGQDHADDVYVWSSRRLPRSEGLPGENSLGRGKNPSRHSSSSPGLPGCNLNVRRIPA